MLTPGCGPRLQAQQLTCKAQECINSSYSHVFCLPGINELSLQRQVTKWYRKTSSSAIAERPCCRVGLVLASSGTGTGRQYFADIPSTTVT